MFGFVFKNLRKPPLSIDLTHKLQSIITNKNINIESRRMCFNYAIEILKSTPPNHAIQLETLLSHKQQQLLFNVKPNRWGSAQVDLLLTYFKTNFQANAKTVIRYILSCNPPHTSPKLSQLIETLLYWSKFLSTITKLSKEEIASLHYLIKLMPEENLIELFDTHLGHLLLINHFDDLFTHLTDKPYGLYLLKRIITAVSKTKITIPEKNLTRIALYIMQGHDLVSLKLLLSHRKFNLSTKAKITVARDLMSFRPTNMQADEITTTLFKFAYFSGRSNDVLRIVSQHTQLSPAEEKAFLSELQEAYTTNTYYSNTYFSLMTIVLDPFHNIIPPAHSEEVTDSELKQYFMSLSDSPLCGDIILLILSFLCPSASMLQATESHCNRIVQNQTFSGEKEKDKMKLLTLFMSTFHSSHWKKRRQKPLNCEEKNLHTFWLSKDKKLCTKEPIHTTLPLSGNNLIHVLTYRRKNLSQHPLVNKAIDRLSQLSFEKKSDFANEQRIKSMLVAFDALESFINRVGYIKALDHEDNGSYIKHQAIVEEVVNCIEDLERISIDKRTQKKDALANLFESIWNGEHHEHQPAFVTEVFV